MKHVFPIFYKPTSPRLLFYKGFKWLSSPWDVVEDYFFIVELENWGKSYFSSSARDLIFEF